MHKVHIFLILVVSLLVSACEKDDKNELLTGKIIGYVELHDRYGYDYNKDTISNHNGILVHFKSGNSNFKAYTDSSGRFEINNLETGTYTIQFSKDDYFDHKITGYQFVGGNEETLLNDLIFYRGEEVVSPYGLMKKYTFKIEDLQMDTINGDSLYYSSPKCKLIVDDENIKNKMHFCRYYVSDDPNVSYKNYQYTGFIYFYDANNEGYNSFSWGLPNCYYQFGTQLYIKCYPSIEERNYYTDLNTGLKIYTSLYLDGASNVLAFKNYKYFHSECDN